MVEWPRSERKLFRWTVIIGVIFFFHHWENCTRRWWRVSSFAISPKLYLVLLLSTANFLTSVLKPPSRSLMQNPHHWSLSRLNGDISGRNTRTKRNQISESVLASPPAVPSSPPLYHPAQHHFFFCHMFPIANIWEEERREGCVVEPRGGNIPREPPSKGLANLVSLQLNHLHYGH